MKRMITLLLILAIAAIPFTAMANEILVKVNKNNSSNYRSEPSLEGEKMGAVGPGEEMLFACETSVDDRGVVWYKVWTSDNVDEQAWISSKYTSLTDGEVDGVDYAEDMCGAMKVLSDDTLAADPYKAIGEVNVKAGDIVYGAGYTVTVDGEHVWLKVSCNDGENEGWLDTLNLEKTDEE